MKQFVLIVFLLFTVKSNAFHPVHLSVVNMELNEQEGIITYSIRLFQDDILYLLGMLVHEELHKGRSEEDAFSDTTLIPRYFQQSLTIVCDNREINPTLSNQLINETEIWLYFEAPISQSPKEITIENKIYTEIFPDQINMLIFAFGEIEKAFTFNSTYTRQLITLNQI